MAYASFVKGPDPALWKQILLSRFTGQENAGLATDPCLPVLQEIGALLSHLPTCNKLLKLLEGSLCAEYGLGKEIPSLQKLAANAQGFKLGDKKGVDKLEEFKRQFNELRQKDAKRHVKFNGLLDTVLGVAEGKAGFSKPVATLAGVFTPELFAKVLEQAMHFKDPGVTPAHGDHTHRIQWWMVYTAIELPKPLTWPEVFKKLPAYTFKITGARDGGRRDLWSFLFDYLESEMSVPGRSSSGYTRPEDLNAALMAGDAATPLLQAIMTARWNKRHLMAKSSFTMQDKLWSVIYKAAAEVKGLQSYAYTNEKGELDMIALALVPAPKI